MAALVWRLIGKNPQAVRKILSGDARIEVSGPVENARRRTGRRREVVVVPLLAGSGTRFKVIEAWAARTAVVQHYDRGRGPAGAARRKSTARRRTAARLPMPYRSC